MSNNFSSNQLIIISSPSGAGKSSICKRLILEDKSIKISISDTTRPPRNNEIDGNDYNFISMEKFKNRIVNNEYIEYANVFGNYYGSLYENVNDTLNKGFDILFDIDWQGSLQLKKSQYPNILTIFIIPPSKDAIYKRLKQRALRSGDNAEAINERLNLYETEMSHKNEYQYVVVNDDFENCISEIKSIIDKARFISNKGS